MIIVYYQDLIPKSNSKG